MPKSYSLDLRERVVGFGSLLLRCRYAVIDDQWAVAHLAASLVALSVERSAARLRYRPIEACPQSPPQGRA